MQTGASTTTTAGHNLKKLILPLLIGTLSVLLAVIILVFFNPLKGLFDDVFVEQDDETLGDVGFKLIWRDSENSEYRTAADTPVKMVERYFECFYTALGDKEADCTQALSNLYASSCEDLVYDLAALSSCAMRLEGSAVDLGMKSVNVHLWLKNIVPVGNDGYIITVRQSAEIIFGSLKGISSGEGIYDHTFVFEKYSGNWYITSHECGQGVWGYGQKVMNTLCGSGSPSYDMLREKLKDFRKVLPSKISAVSDLIMVKGYGALPEVQQPYNREGAMEYAKRWSNAIDETRNTEIWNDYDDDSVNFVSQCIFGGIGKMDVEGKNKWKWFDPKIDLESSDSGCSNSWFKAESFWAYCTENDHRGVCCLAGAAGGQLEKGDVVQLMLNGTAVSQVIVTDVVTDVRKNTLELLVTGHDNEYVNFPLSLIPCDSVRFIKVVGWND